MQWKALSCIQQLTAQKICAAPAQVQEEVLRTTRMEKFRAALCQLRPGAADMSFSIRRRPETEAHALHRTLSGSVSQCRPGQSAALCLPSGAAWLRGLCCICLPRHNKKDSRKTGVLFYRLMKALLFIGDIVGTLLGNPTADACLLQHIFRQLLFLRGLGFCYLCTGSFLFRLGLIGVDLLGPLTGAHQNPDQLAAHMDKAFRCCSVTGLTILGMDLDLTGLDGSYIGRMSLVGMSKFSLTAIPFFILAGNLMNQGGIAKRLVDFVMAILGKLPGALLVTNVGANALFGAI